MLRKPTRVLSKCRRSAYLGCGFLHFCISYSPQYCERFWILVWTRHSSVIHNRCTCPRVYTVGLKAAAWWTIGVLCWCSDRFFCHIWRDVIRFPYLHSAWWEARKNPCYFSQSLTTAPLFRHVLVCIGSYMACVCYAYFFAVYEAPEQSPALKFWPHDSHTWFGIPYVTLKTVRTKPVKLM